MPIRVLGTTLHPRAFARHLRVAWRALFDAQTAEAEMFASPQDFPGLAHQLAQLRTTIPQADVVETSLQTLEYRQWREHFMARLQGHGLEIGPLHRPMPLHEGTTVDYIDRFSVADLRAHYPELQELDLVEPTILGDAETMAGVSDARYDFVIASHVIEHMRNPIGALATWCRVTRPGGLVYLVAPDKRAIFDKQRVRTTLEHMVLDFRQPSRDRDYEHFLDYAVQVDGKGDNEGLAHAERLAREDYSIHFHVFMPGDLLRLVGWFAANVRPVTVVEGPSMEPGGDEFHLMIRT